MADLADLSTDAPRWRSSPPCVALQAAECQANPNRAVQYTLVPEQYRDAKGLLANMRACVQAGSATGMWEYCQQQASQAG